MHLRDLGSIEHVGTTFPAAILSTHIFVEVSPGTCLDGYIHAAMQALLEFMPYRIAAVIETKIDATCT